MEPEIGRYAGVIKSTHMMDCDGHTEGIGGRPEHHRSRKQAEE
jgi:hypothetical protein